MTALVALLWLAFTLLSLQCFWWNYVEGSKFRQWVFGVGTATASARLFEAVYYV